MNTFSGKRQEQLVSQERKENKKLLAATWVTGPGLAAGTWEGSLQTQGCCLGTKGLTPWPGPETGGPAPGSTSLSPGARGRQGRDP